MSPIVVAVFANMRKAFLLYAAILLSTGGSLASSGFSHQNPVLDGDDVKVVFNDESCETAKVFFENSVGKTIGKSLGIDNVPIMMAASSFHKNTFYMTLNNPHFCKNGNECRILAYHYIQGTWHLIYDVNGVNLYESKSPSFLKVMDGDGHVHIRNPVAINFVMPR